MGNEVQPNSLLSERDCALHIFVPVYCRRFCSKVLLLGVLALFSSALFAKSSSGTGFVITKSGHIVTNYHVVERASRITVRDSADNRFQARLVLSDAANDIAILKIEGSKHPPLPIRTSSQARKGQTVFTIGFPNATIQGFESKVTEGIISSLSGIGGEPNSFQISVPIQPGNSGGPLIDLSGSVVGITASKLSSISMLNRSGVVPENVNYAIKSNYLIELLSTNESIRTKIVTATSDRPLTLPKLVSRAEESVVLIVVSIAEEASRELERTPPPSTDRQAPESRRESDARGIQLFDEGLSAYNQKDFAKAFVSFGDAASRGHMLAQYHLGVMFFNGYGVNANQSEAYAWFRKAAEQGHRGSQAWTCQMLRRAQGVPKDDTGAVKWCELAASQGEPWAMGQLALIYRFGQGTGRDDAKAFFFANKGAEAGNVDAMALLGALYFEGIGTAKNISESFRWSDSAARKGNAAGMNQLGYMYLNGIGVARDDVIACSWFRDAAIKAHPAANFNLGGCYEFGRGVVKDEKEALKWYQRAVDLGHERARAKVSALTERMKSSSLPAPRS